MADKADKKKDEKVAPDPERNERLQAENIGLANEGDVEEQNKDVPTDAQVKADLPEYDHQKHPGHGSQLPPKGGDVDAVDGDVGALGNADDDDDDNDK